MIRTFLAIFLALYTTVALAHDRGGSDYDQDYGYENDYEHGHGEWCEDEHQHHPARYETVYCNRYNSPCFPNGRIVRARLVHDYSGSCYLDHNWGVTTDYVWASRRCDAQFEVQVRRGRRH